MNRRFQSVECFLTGFASDQRLWCCSVNVRLVFTPFCPHDYLRLCLGSFHLYTSNGGTLESVQICICFLLKQPGFAQKFRYLTYLCIYKLDQILHVKPNLQCINTRRRDQERDWSAVFFLLLLSCTQSRLCCSSWAGPDCEWEELDTWQVDEELNFY